MADGQRQTVTAVYLGLGTNLGDRETNLRQGLRLLAQKVHLVQASSVYETEPWGYTQQPRFLNMVCLGETALLPLELLAFCQKVERQAGRKPTFRYGPRVLDIDILAYDNQVVDLPGLTIPHPGLEQRAFVLAPLAEVAQAWVHPILGRTVQELLDALEETEPMCLWGPSLLEEEQA
ncbi:MAG: 2-amino-4-hydroxy-6-hydroxymethyldihydropteridine diphosphokinase [Chloroflexi bacterium]|nr:2-amino-4-hydroxy-6-hydroxymethyldihydropteridine diphosphokinase [Chloroflexota bacterium]